jgi:hypothetical protein
MLVSARKTEIGDWIFPSTESVWKFAMCRDDAAAAVFTAKRDTAVSAGYVSDQTGVYMES